MRDPTTRTAREAKRRSGIFYTPADVAEYMAGGVLSRQDLPQEWRYLDPRSLSEKQFTPFAGSCRRRPPGRVA